MKTLFQFIAPALKAITQVIGLIVSLTITSYYGIKAIAKAEGQVVEEKMMAVRTADFQHINSRFDSHDSKFESINDRFNRHDRKLDRIIDLIERQHP